MQLEPRPLPRAGKIFPHANSRRPRMLSKKDCAELLRKTVDTIGRERQLEKNGGADETRTRDLLRDSWQQEFSDGMPLIGMLSNFRAGTGDFVPAPSTTVCYRFLRRGGTKLGTVVLAHFGADGASTVRVAARNASRRALDAR